MPILLIVNGFAGTGKTTTTNLFAKKNNFAFISQDEFLFQLNAYVKTRELSGKEHKVAIKNMHDCALNYMHQKRDIVIEGALVSISKKDPLDVRDFIKLGERMSYKVKVITFIADDKVRDERQKKRKYTVGEKIDEKLQSAIKIIDEKIKDEIVIDTSNYKVEEVIKKLEEIIT